MVVSRLVGGLISLAAALWLAAANAYAADEKIGPFLLVDGVEDIIILADKIEISAPYEFLRAVELRPNATTLVLRSPGGQVYSALTLAELVHKQGLNTHIPADSGCYSACVYVYFAGASHVVDGELGVHQMTGEDLQPIFGHIYAVMQKFGTHAEVVRRMMSTDPRDMHNFTREEIDRFGINRIVEVTATRGPPGRDEDDEEELAPEPEPEPEEPVRRIATYEGLDFYGGDLFRDNARNLRQCSEACVADSACTAFTFNNNPAHADDDNCFIKRGFDTVDAYSLAISGLILDEGEEEVPVYEVRTIDITQDVMQNTSLSPQGPATSGVRTVNACRAACIADRSCTAFTYRTSRRQCWLMEDDGREVSASGYVSGIKRTYEFDALSVLPIED